MIRGSVTSNRQAVVTLLLRGPTGLETVIDAMVDSGFNGILTLTRSQVEKLKLVRRSRIYGTLADGTTHVYDVFGVWLHWMGQWRIAPASVIGDETLLGMELLEGHELKIAVTPGGAVEITPLP